MNQKKSKKQWVDLYANEEKRESNYKTVMCKNWGKNKQCPYKNCTFAHGEKELNFHLYGNPEGDISSSEDDDSEEDYYEKKA